jgi:hypothetical protein
MATLLVAAYVFLTHTFQRKLSPSALPNLDRA